MFEHQSNSLHITNGDSAVHNLKSAGFTGTFLPIRDAYHVGPLLPDDDFLAVPSARCRYIVEQGWASAEQVRLLQTERRGILSDLESYAGIYLWFEHDLYDQLQLLRVLHFLSQTAVDINRVSLIVTDQYLGEADDQTCQELLRFQELLTREHLQLGQHIWQQLTAPSPADWPKMLDLELDVLPFVPSALQRFFAEFPAVRNGLGLSAQTALESLSEPIQAGRLFARAQAREAARFMGDTQFFNMLESMMQGPAALLRASAEVPLMEEPSQIVHLTELGQQVVFGQVHYMDVCEPDFWLGGVHISSGQLWCYNHSDQTFQQRTS
jgi:hypothetical protein